MISPGVERRFVTVDDPRWAQAHASTVHRSADEVLVAWFAGTREGTPDNAIWLSRRDCAEATWSSPTRLTDHPVAHWNPVLAAGPDGSLWLFYKRGERISQWSTWFLRSHDNGGTWSESAQLVPGDVGGRGPVKNPPLLLEDGAWLAPASRERWDGDAAVWECFVDVSDDKGATWTQSPIPLDRSRLRGSGVIQPALWWDGASVRALMRSSEGRAFLSTSADGGRTWSEAQPTELANNNSALTVVALPDGRVACVHNPVGEDWGARCPLSMSVSADGGLTWEERAVIEDGETPVDADPRHAPRQQPDAGSFLAGDAGVVTSGVGEYSYPSAVLDGHDHVLVTYTWQRRGIAEARVPMNLLRS